MSKGELIRGYISALGFFPWHCTWKQSLARPSCVPLVLVYVFVFVDVMLQILKPAEKRQRFNYAGVNQQGAPGSRPVTPPRGPTNPSRR